MKLEIKAIEKVMIRSLFWKETKSSNSRKKKKRRVKELKS
jgi:hypothetical protein